MKWQRPYVKKDMPVLEDCLGGFAVLEFLKMMEVSPILRTDVGKETFTIGRWVITTGSFKKLST